MIYVLIVVLVLILGILFYHFVLKSDNNQEKEYKVSDKDKDTLEIKDKYMFQIEIKVLEILNSIDPKKYLALPKVCMGSMLLPKGSKNVYNLLSNKVLDYVIFDRQTMKKSSKGRKKGRKIIQIKYPFISLLLTKQKQKNRISS